MAEINNAVALGINANPIDLKSTLGTLSQIELAQAHKGLYNIQELQQRRQFNALQAAADAYRGGQDPVASYLSAGGDPSGGQTLQSMFYEKGARDKAGGGVFSPQQVEQLTGAQKQQAETKKIGFETDVARANNQARIAQGYLANPSDASWAGGVAEAQRQGIIGTMDAQRLLAVRNPQEREGMARQWIGSGVSPSDYTAPHNVSPTDIVTSRAGMINRPPIPSTGRVVGDDEAVRRGLYDPTREQTQRGISPAQQVANRFGVITPATTSAAQKEATQYAEGLGKLPEQLAERATAAKNMNFTLDQMRSETETWPMGKGSTALMTASQYMKPIANAFGSTVFDKPVADYEAFNKNAGTLVRQAVKEVSSRAAVQEFQMIQNQLPSGDMSRQGFNQIVDQFQAVNDYQIAKQQAAQAYRDRNGTLDKFEPEWNKNISPTAFLVQRLSPEQFTDIATKLQKTPAGRQTLNSLRSQMMWANQNGLF